MNNKKLEEIYARLDNLISQQSAIQVEIAAIKKELNYKTTTTTIEENTKINNKTTFDKPLETAIPTLKDTDQTAIGELKKANSSLNKTANPSKKKSINKIFETVDFERFIGENLLNKIGILVLIIGVGIGVKYAIDRDLVSPLIRVINGYGVGIALLLTAIRLKKNYHDFSAVLLSGAMAVFYFITFAAHSFYNLIPQLPTFGIMVFFTLFTVFASVRYNRQIVAHLGLVGAYAVPFLLNSEPGKLTVFFSYLAILNLGILAIAFQRSWKNLFYVAFTFTWFIVIFIWVNDFFVRFNSFSAENANLTLFFCSLFFLTFYAIFLAQKLLKKEALSKGDLLCILSNSFIYFVLGYFILGKKFPGQSEVLSFFAIVNVVVHLAVAALLFIRRQAHKGLFRLVVGLAIAFLTIVIPIQLNGHWVTLLWAVEAALIFWLAGKEKDKVFEKFSFALVVIAFSSFMWNCRLFGSSYYTYSVFLNPRILSNLLFTFCFGFMLYLIYKNKVDIRSPDFDIIRKVFYIAIPAIVLIVSFLTFSIEVEAYFNKLQYTVDRSIENYYLVKSNWRYYNSIWQINLLIFFVIFWCSINQIKVKNKYFGTVLFILGILSILIFATSGLDTLEGLRSSYLETTQITQFTGNKNNILIRYISYGFVAALLLAMKNLTVVERSPFKKKIVWEFCLIATLIIIASSELINIAALTGAYSAYKMGLTILWALCSLILIALGILWNRKDFRIVAIALFAIVLLKLFFYDLVELETISKTVVFITIGILLLIISFLYNKFKARLFNE